MLQVKQVLWIRILPEKINIKRHKLENEYVKNEKQSNLYRTREENITNSSI